MQISDDRYFHDRRRHDLALRMIRHEARTCTIRSCTGLSDDRIRRLYRTYATHLTQSPLRRRRGKSPRQGTFFIRNARAQLESSVLASVFTVFGLMHPQTRTSEPIEFTRLFCDAYETHRQLLEGAEISFEHAWSLLKLLRRREVLSTVRCRHCDSQFLQHSVGGCRRTCPVCKLKQIRPDRPCSRTVPRRPCPP